MAGCHPSKRQPLPGNEVLWRACVQWQMMMRVGSENNGRCLAELLAGRTARERSEIWNSWRTRQQGWDRRPAGPAEGRSGRPILADTAGPTGQRSAFIVDPLQVLGAHGGPFQGDDAAALEDAVEDGRG